MIAALPQVVTDTLGGATQAVGDLLVALIPLAILVAIIVYLVRTIRWLGIVVAVAGLLLLSTWAQDPQQINTDLSNIAGVEAP